MNKAYRKQGFTLVELLVAVVLMLILVGGVARIFKHTSDAVLLADATMTITQNSRAMIDTMSRDLASVQVGASGTGPYMVLSPPVESTTAAPIPFMEFDTITSWWNAGTDGEGVARVRYYLTRSAVDTNRWSMWRDVSIDGGTTWPIQNVVAQYVMANGNTPRLMIEYYNDPTPGDPSNSDGQYLQPDAANPPTALPSSNADKRFHEGDIAEGALPSSIRITVDLTDRRREVIRHYSQVFWIATGVH